MFFVQLAETAAEAERLRAVLAARYGLAPHDAADHHSSWSAGGELRERLAARVARLGLGHVVLQCGTTEVLARVGAEVLSGPR